MKKKKSKCQFSVRVLLRLPARSLSFSDSHSDAHTIRTRIRLQQVRDAFLSHKSNRINVELSSDPAMAEDEHFFIHQSSFKPEVLNSDLYATFVFSFAVGDDFTLGLQSFYRFKKLKRSEKKHLYEALAKIKDELMLMGFISLLLAFLQQQIAKLCMPELLLDFWLPCGFVPRKNHHNSSAHFQITSSGVLSNRGRHLLSAGGAASCSEGKVPFISLGVLHDLHHLIFILAVVHVVTCTVTVLLGEVQISQWWKWEEDIRKRNQLVDANKTKVIDIRSLTFIRERFEGVDANKRNYVSNFFKHLCGIVTQADYEAMRFGFILTHCNGNQRFNFHRYIVYAYEGDFEEVVSISWFLWLLVIISLSLNVAGWHIYMWISTTALILLLVVGTKLQQVITELATYVAQRHTVIVGDMSIKPSDEYFWFQQPKIFLFFIHCVIFLNSYSLAIFFWVVFTFGFHSCAMGEAKYIYPRIVIMVIIQAICSYSTLPLYAIVTQMGNSYNEEAMSRAACWSSPTPEPEEPAEKHAAVEMTSK